MLSIWNIILHGSGAIVEDPIIQKFLAGIRGLERKLKSIYFFGSRARGTERPDSDYDLLLVVSEDFTLKDKDKLYDIVMDVLLETSRLVSLKIFKQAHFKKLCAMGTPFMTTVLKEGIKIG